MPRTRIEWCDASINPVKGLCPMACDYCYARRMYKRFKWPERLEFQYAHLRHEIGKIKKPSKIFIGSTMELFGEWIKYEWVRDIFEAITHYPQHTFIFLTKQPQNLQKWSPFPDNCWIGVSATNHEQYKTGLFYLRDVKASVRFSSFEPLLHRIDVSYGLLDWVIIGQQTPVRAATTPKVEWIREIVEAADKARVPVFLKDNLKNLIFTEGIKHKALDWALNSHGYLRQEFPK